MKNAVIVSTYFNNPHFIQLQAESFKQFVKDDYDFVVVENSFADTKSILSDQPSGPEIAIECQKYRARHIHTPLSVFKHEKDGGLIPNGFPLGHPTEWHRANVSWIMQNLDSLGLTQYKYLVLIESDMILRKPISISDYLSDCDIAAHTRKNVLTKLIDNPDQYWPDWVTETEVDAHWFSFQLMLINLQVVHNIDQASVCGFAGSDTGGLSHFWIKTNPQYNIKFITKFTDIPNQIEFLSKEPGSWEEAEFLHYRAGTNWDYQKREYYAEKLRRMLKKFAPELYNETPGTGEPLTSRDGEHTFQPE